MNEKFFHLTKITVEVLSEEPYNPTTLEQVAFDIMCGDQAGVWHIVERRRLSGGETALALMEQGSDPEFFGLDANGNELERE